MAKGYITEEDLVTISACSEARTWFADKYGTRGKTADVLLAAIRAGHPSWASYFLECYRGSSKRRAQRAVKRALTNALLVASPGKQTERLDEALRGESFPADYSAFTDIPDVNGSRNMAKRCAVAYALSAYVSLQNGYPSGGLGSAFTSEGYFVSATQEIYPRSGTKQFACECSAATSFVRHVFTKKTKARISARKQAA
jgi:hypothetical protein